MKKVLSFLISTCILLQLVFMPKVQAYAAIRLDQDASADSSSKIIQVEDVIKGYYAASYDMWWNMEMGDLTEYLDTDSVQCQNKITAITESIQSWKYAVDNSYYKGHRQRHEIYFNFCSVEINGKNAKATVIISGETTGTPAYPLFISQGYNVFDLKEKDGKWLIYNHDYENDGYLYETSKTKKIKNNFSEKKIQYDKMFKNASVNMQETTSPQPAVVSTYAAPSQSVVPPTYYDFNYSASRAVNYAKQFVTNRNSAFKYYDGADCTNFVSQCLSYGFSICYLYADISQFRMVDGTYGWYGVNGNPSIDSSSAWIYAPTFFNFVTTRGASDPGPRCSIVGTFSNGDIIQMDWNNNNIVDHSAICIDEDNDLFAQHSRNGIYRYLYDYSPAQYYFLHPTIYRVIG